MREFSSSALRSRWLRVAATLARDRTRGRLHRLEDRHRHDVSRSFATRASRGSSLSAFLTVITVPPQAWRWQLLLKARGVFDSLAWLTRAYFVSYAVGQVLPTAVGGDASRIYETPSAIPASARRSPGSVLLERAIGGAVTLLLAAVGLVLASASTTSGRTSGSSCCSSR